MHFLPKLFLFLSFSVALSANAQILDDGFINYEDGFSLAYEQHPEIPKGVLEAISYTKTKIRHLDESELESCIGLPRAYGIFGLIADGKGYFRNTLSLIADLSHGNTASIKHNPEVHIMAYAKALALVSGVLDWSGGNLAQRISLLSELPIETPIQKFALETELFSILSLLNDVEFMSALGYAPLHLDLKSIFGDNLTVLSSDRIFISGDEIQTESGETYMVGGGIAPCYDYDADSYIQTPTCNYSSRSGTPISAVTIHTVQGTYAGAISWAQNCNANVSYHYVVSSTGQITQMLCEADKGWHVGTENTYTIGIEHDGYVSDPNNYTEAMYQATANLVHDISESGYGISPLRTAYFPWASTTYYNASSAPGACVHIKGHQHYPNQSHTDPGQYWDWDYFYKLINPNTTVTTLTDPSGDFFDDGGQIGVYSSDLRSLTLIQPTGASSVSVTFQEFDLENEWDYLYIYDGTTVFSPLIGYYTGSDDPGTITSPDGHLLFEFRSDCAIAEPGWEATYTGQFDPVGIQPSSVERLQVFPNPTTGIVNLPPIDGLKWRLFDATGRIIAEGWNERNIDLSTFGLPEQVFILKLLTDKMHSSIRLAHLKQ